MNDYFTLNVDNTQLNNMNILALAHIGDAVYELLCRGWLCSHKMETIGNLHRATVAMVKAPAQAAAVKKLLPYLTDKESSVFRRGRNANVHQIPKNARRSDYTHATALEALFGWLYLQGQRERINQLFAIIMEETEEPNHAT
jgi:ribonuclease-3 family protein